jgi:hypothetical protein
MPDQRHMQDVLVTPTGNTVKFAGLPWQSAAMHLRTEGEHLSREVMKVSV